MPLLGTDENRDGTVQEAEISPVIGNFEVKAYPQLLKLCGDMDSAWLHKFVSDNRKNLASLKEEIPVAFKAAANLASLVLNSLEGFYPMEAPNTDGKKDANLLGMRRTCLMLMECLSILLSGLDRNSLAAVLQKMLSRKQKLLLKDGIHCWEILRWMPAMVRDNRTDWVLKVNEPIAGNYYPLNLGIYTKDKKVELSVLVDRATGGGSIKDGEIELMLHRRTCMDDPRGVEESLEETVCINGTCTGLRVYNLLAGRRRE
ncbi:unnamed protein product [Eruca vesicaria subsp. sativa]|uniref:FRIGIDA-like protein n=1 Tax=Eruca vesicaria subsp. sativa TaxID=29727 RepID=A0ABC8JAS4_ERUVS|nr:unnamed protein product [Eruca vesicaria subsp. sativa]